MKTGKHESIKNVVFLGEARFPYGLASIQRMILMSKALLQENINVTVICRKGSWDSSFKPDFKYKGIFEGIDYVYTSGHVHKPSGFFKRNISKIKGIWGEYRLIQSLKKQGQLDAAILSNRKIRHVIRYLFYAKLFRFPLVFNLVELTTSLEVHGGFLRKWNAKILDKHLIRYFDGALPISDKLVEFYRNSAPSKPYIKLPILCDYSQFMTQPDRKEAYFLYCSSLAYKEVIDFVLDSYGNLDSKNTPKLYMIISSESKEALDKFRKEITALPNSEKFHLFSNIPYAQLVQLYVEAKALLIPLRPTLQDESRFPHKIGEYLASGNPVVTTAIGEIKTYFEDGKTALVSTEYNEDSFAEKLRFILERPEEARSIGKRGQELGLREFDFRAHAKRLHRFLAELE